MDEHEAARKGLAQLGRSMDRAVRKLPFQTVGFLTILGIFQGAYMLALRDSEGFDYDGAFYYLILPAVIISYGLVARIKFEDLRLFGVLVFLGFMLIATWALTMLLFGYLGGMRFGTLPSSAWVGTFAMQMLYVAPSEELIFRFAFPQSLLHYFGKRKKGKGYAWAAVLLPQVSFALYHWTVYQGDVGQMATAFAFGCMMMGLYYVPVPERLRKALGKRVGLGGCIGAHAAYNLTLLGVISGGVT